MKTLILTITALYLSFNALAQTQSPSFVWAKNAGSSGSDIGNSISVDSNGNSYVLGYFSSSTITIGSTTLTNNGYNNIFIAKYDSDGNVLWAKSAGCSNSDHGNSIYVDTNGNFYITGFFQSSTITFGNTTLTNSGGLDIFNAKYDSEGNVLWAKSAGSSGEDNSNSIYIDSDGNSYITGYFRSSTITFGSTTLTNNGEQDIFIAKYDSDGNVLWAKSAGGSMEDYGNSISVDSNGNSYITGNFRGSTITFGTTTLTNNGSFDIFIAKYDSEGNILWAKSAGSSGEDNSNSIYIDSNGNSYITGYFRSSTITFGSTTLTNNGSGYDIFFAKYDSDGNVLWAKNAGGSNSDYANSIYVDSNGNSYITGYFNSSTITFGSITLTKNGSGNDIFIAKYDSDGNVLWAKSAGGSSDDYGNSIYADSNGNSYVTGYFGSSSITFGTTTLTNNLGNDIFISKLCYLALSFNIISSTICNGSKTTATITPEGGVSPYTYNWLTTPAQYSQTATELSIGSYNCTVTDNIGCATIANVNIVADNNAEYAEICMVTVDTSSNKNKIIYRNYSEYGHVEYKIYKETGLNQYSLIGSVPYSNSSTYIDTTSQPESHGDNYAIRAIDSCGNESLYSSFHKTINLTVAVNGTTMGLNWDDYIVFDSQWQNTWIPSKYYIFRGNGNNLALYDSISSSFHSYNDYNVTQSYYYMIGAKIGTGCNTNKSTDSFSFSNKKQNFSNGIDEVVNNEKMKIYPNPFSEKTIIEFENTNSEKCSLSLKDILGKEVKVYNINTSKLEIEKSDLSTGIYTIEIKGKTINCKGKLIIE